VRIALDTTVVHTLSPRRKDVQTWDCSPRRRHVLATVDCANAKPSLSSSSGFGARDCRATISIVTARPLLIGFPRENVQFNSNPVRSAVDPNRCNMRTGRLGCAFFAIEKMSLTPRMVSWFIYGGAILVSAINAVAAAKAVIIEVEVLDTGE